MGDMSAYYHHTQPPTQPYPSYYHQPPPPPATAIQHYAAPPATAIHHYAPPAYQQQPPPYDPYAPTLYAPQPSIDEVRTLFVAGLPEDVKNREIYNLFREFPGYESSHLRNPARKNSLPFAFAVFADKLSAVGAMQALNGMEFDLEKGSTLYIDLAKENSRSKRSRADYESNGLDKRAKGPADFLRSSADTGVGSVHMSGMNNSACNMIGFPPAQSYSNYVNRAVIVSPASRSNAQPCPTLFVAKLGPTCTEQELIQIFSRCPGYLRLKMQNTYGSPVAFVDFQDTPSSTGALYHLQGKVLYSSVAGEGMRLEYAKSRMGLRRKHK